MSMLKRFFGGLFAGAGFAVGIVLIGVFALGLWRPFGVAPFLPSIGTPSGYTPNFHELPIEEQIQKSSVIALARFERGPDGSQKAIITEVLKQTPGTVFYYKIGDEYPEGRHYPTQRERLSDGLIIFFEGSPANTRMSMTYSGERIRSLGDMPLALLREKCAGT